MLQWNETGKEWFMMGSVYRSSNMLPTAFVRERVCSIHGDIARVGFGRMSITIACVSRIVDGGALVSLCYLSDRIGHLCLWNHETIRFRPTDTLPLGGNDKLRSHSQTPSTSHVLSWLSSSTFNNSPRSIFLFFKTIPNILESFF